MYICESSKSLVATFVGAEIFIVLNLYILKYFLSFPDLFWLNIIGPSESIFIAIDIIKKIGNKITMPRKAMTISIVLFIKQ